jgi:VanZ family protein
MTARLRTYARILLLLYLAAVCVLCFAQFDDTPSVPFSIFGIPNDKVVHFLMFAPFPFLAWFSFGKRPARRKRLLILGAILLVGFVLAVFTEGIQWFIPYRSGDWRDLAADSLGLLASTLILIPPVCLKD